MTRHGVAVLGENIFEMTKKYVVELDVTLFVVEGSRMAVYGPFSELRGPVVVGT